MNLGPTHLIVSHLDRSVAFYQDAIGLQVHRRDDDEAVLGAGEDDVLVLRQQPGARPAGRHAGLYHVALLFPTREELARAVHRLAVTRTPIEGASDHGVSEAVYLPDPDGNGIELYADRPRDQWPTPEPGEKIAMFTAPLDLHALLGILGDEPLIPRAAPGLTVGHMHLHVSDLDAAVEFYTRELGLDVMTTMGGVAAFLSWDGYHHHLGLNTWRGVGIPDKPDDAVGLDSFTVVGVDGVERRVQDPSGNVVLLTAGRPVTA
ncbi:MAG: Glyoxalase/bleomycin resistance protein/dioxygenase [Solirubrobacterales bacterium]|nr:Glyoxalase/bleomycin resistance protein/dioxygenase [Solirubrobacterales bacterium]